VAFAGLLLLVFPGRRRALRNWRSLVAMLILSAAMFTVAGCSSSGTTTTAPPVLTGGTTAGTYTLTVIGTSGGQTQTATSTITIN
jgi:hypothetical protein